MKYLQLSACVTLVIFHLAFYDTVQSKSISGREQLLQKEPLHIQHPQFHLPNKLQFQSPSNQQLHLPNQQKYHPHRQQNYYPRVKKPAFMDYQEREDAEEYYNPNYSLHDDRTSKEDKDAGGGGGDIGGDIDSQSSNNLRFENGMDLPVQAAMYDTADDDSAAVILNDENVKAAPAAGALILADDNADKPLLPADTFAVYPESVSAAGTDADKTLPLGSNSANILPADTNYAKPSQADIAAEYSQAGIFAGAAQSQKADVPAQSLQGDVAAQPLQADVAAQPLQADVPAQPLHADVAAQPLQADVPAQPVQADVAAQPVQADVAAQPLQADVPAQPLQADVAAQPLHADVPAQPLHADVAAQPLHADVAAQPLQADVAAESLQADVPAQPLHADVPAAAETSASNEKNKDVASSLLENTKPVQQKRTSVDNVNNIIAVAAVDVIKPPQLSVVDSVGNSNNAAASDAASDPVSSDGDRTQEKQSQAGLPIAAVGLPEVMSAQRNMKENTKLEMSSGSENVAVGDVNQAVLIRADVGSDDNNNYNKADIVAEVAVPVAHDVNNVNTGVAAAAAADAAAAAAAVAPVQTNNAEEQQRKQQLELSDASNGQQQSLLLPANSNMQLQQETNSDTDNNNNKFNIFGADNRPNSSLDNKLASVAEVSAEAENNLPAAAAAVAAANSASVNNFNNNDDAEQKQIPFPPTAVESVGQTGAESVQPVLPAAPVVVPNVPSHLDVGSPDYAGNYPDEEAENNNNNNNKDTNINSNIDGPDRNVNSNDVISSNNDNGGMSFQQQQFNANNNRDSSLDMYPQLVPGTAVNDKDSHFFAYFASLLISGAVAYTVYHNRNKLLALVLEGRKGGRRPSLGSRGGRRRGGGRGGGGAAYTPLHNNLDEAITANNGNNSSNNNNRVY